VLGCFVLHERLPPEILAGSLADLGRPIVTQVGLALDEDRMYSNVWGALGGELKPAVNVVCTAPFDVSRSLPVGPPVTEEPRITVERPDADDGETVRRQRNGTRARTGSRQNVGPGSAPDLDDVDTDVAEMQDEIVRGGKESDPGRVYRVRGMPR
jgi:hypothetical protein